MNAIARARRSGVRLQLALVIGALALVLIHLSLTYAVLGELDRRLIVLDGGLAVLGLAVAFWYVGSLVEERQRHALELVLLEVLTVPRDIAETAQEALAVLHREGLADAAAIAVADDMDSAMHPIAAVGYPDGWMRNAEPDRLPDAAERPSFAREREPHRWVAPVTDRVARQPWVARVPLFSGDDPIGLLLLAAARPGVLRDTHLLDTLGMQLSAALDHAAMYEAAYQRERDLEEQDYRRLEVMAAFTDDTTTVTSAPEPAATEDASDAESAALGVTSEELEEHMESPIQGVDRLNVLIDDLMDLGRSGFEYAVEPEEVDVTDVVRRMSEGLRPAMTQREITISDEMPRRPIVVVTDPMLIEKVVLNVLSNATRHAPAGGTVVLYARRTGDGRARVEIYDNGARIDPEDRERIFEPYYRVRRAEAAPVPGAGLGLAVARRIVETLEGRIWVDERDEPGARICIEIPGALPLDRVASAAPDTSAEEAEENDSAGAMVPATGEERERVEDPAAPIASEEASTPESPPAVKAAPAASWTAPSAEPEDGAEPSDSGASDEPPLAAERRPFAVPAPTFAAAPPPESAAEAPEGGSSPPPPASFEAPAEPPPPPPVDAATEEREDEPEAIESSTERPWWAAEPAEPPAAGNVVPLHPLAALDRSVPAGLDSEDSQLQLLEVPREADEPAPSPSDEDASFRALASEDPPDLTDADMPADVDEDPYTDEDDARVARFTAREHRDDSGDAGVPSPRFEPRDRA